MEIRKFKILKRKDDCVLLSKRIYDEGRDSYRTKYIVKDIEGDVITICYDNFEQAEKIFDGYDIEKVREEKKKVFLGWLEEFAEA